MVPLVIVVLLGAVLDPSFACDWSAINACVHTFQQAQPTGQNPLALPSYDVAQMNAYCNDYSTYERCLRPLLAQCEKGSTSVAALEGQLEGIDILCNDDRSDYQTNKDCTSSDEVAEAMRNCNDTLFRKMKYIKSLTPYVHSETTIRRIKRMLVRSVNAAHMCHQRSVLHCGWPAVDLIGDVSDAVLDELKDVIEGSKWDDRDDDDDDKDHDPDRDDDPNDGDHDNDPNDDDLGDDPSDDDHDDYPNDNDHDDGPDDDGREEHPNDGDDDDKDDEFGVGAIVGIVLGILFLVALVCAAIFYCPKRKASTSAKKAQTAPAVSYTTPTPPPAYPNDAFSAMASAPIYPNASYSATALSSAYPNRVTINMEKTVSASAPVQPTECFKVPASEWQGEMVAPPPYYSTLPPGHSTAAPSTDNICNESLEQQEVSQEKQS